MSEVWVAVAAVGAATLAIKALGPVLLGGRTMPPRLAGVLEALAPAVLAALVVTQTVGHGTGIAVDARLAGVGLAAVAIALRAPMLAVIALAAAVAAVLRAL